MADHCLNIQLVSLPSDWKLKANNAGYIHPSTVQADCLQLNSKQKIQEGKALTFLAEKNDMLNSNLLL